LFFRKRRFGAIGTPAAASCAAKLQLALLVVLPEALVRRDRLAGGASCAAKLQLTSWLFFRKRRFGAIGSPAAPAARRSCSSRSWLFFRKRRFGAIGSPAAASCELACQSKISFGFFLMIETMSIPVRFANTYMAPELLITV
ncbi:hypothetical protein, partial [Paenibacillus thiaminolyticus]